MNRPTAPRTLARALQLALALCLALVLALPAIAQATEAPLAEDPFAQAATVDLADGSYLVEVTLEGGTGRANVTSPVPVEVRAGKAVATIEWSSPNYDYMVVAQERYLPVNTEGNSVFEIPVLALDKPFDVIGDTTAMSVPHEVAYQLTFDAASATAVRTGGIPPLAVPLLAAALALGCLLAVRARRARQAR